MEKLGARIIVRIPDSMAKKLENFCTQTKRLPSDAIRHFIQEGLLAFVEHKHMTQPVYIEPSEIMVAKANKQRTREIQRLIDSYNYEKRKGDKQRASRLKMDIDFKFSGLQNADKLDLYGMWKAIRKNTTVQKTDNNNASTTVTIGQKRGIADISKGVTYGAKTKN